MNNNHCELWNVERNEEAAEQILRIMSNLRAPIGATEMERVDQQPSAGMLDGGEAAACVPQRPHLRMAEDHGCR